MTEAQKIIKYFAIALAVFIIVNIFLGIFFAIYNFSKVFNYNYDKTVNNYTYNTINDFDNNINSIEIDIKNSSLEIKQGDKFKIETTNEDVIVKEKNNKLYVEDKKHLWLSDTSNDNIIIYVPYDIILDNIDIDAGVGNITINSLTARKCDINLGTGSFNAKDLYIYDETDISGGAGKIAINSSTLNNLDLEMGASSLEIHGYINGNSEIETGVGNATIELFGGINNYKLHADKGLGKITVDNENISGNTVVGNGNNTIIIESGVGNVDISFK